MITARGNGPPPPGMYRCGDSKCPAKRDPHTGRFTRQSHYHPIPDRTPPEIARLLRKEPRDV